MTHANTAGATARPLTMQKLGSLALVLALYGGTAWAGQDMERDESEPSADAHGSINKKIEHRLADWVKSANPFGALNGVRHSALPPAGSTGIAGSSIRSHGGPIMPKVSKIVVIWYGNWAQANGTDTAAGQQIILDALYGLAALPNANLTNYAGITTGATSTLSVYSQSGGSSVTAMSSAAIEQVTQITSPSYGGTMLTDAQVKTLVKNSAGSTPDANAIYLVLTSSDISEGPGFLTKYCGWHTYSSSIAQGKVIKYAFIGNPNASLASCSYQTTASPNDNPGVDAMVSVIAHELMETVTDPQLNAWYNSSGYENGDMCAWTFGGAQTPLGNGSYANVTLPSNANGGTRSYLLQRALASSNSKCYINATGKVQ